MICHQGSQRLLVSFVTGHGFSRAAKSHKNTRALAPEGCFRNRSEASCFSPFLSHLVEERFGDYALAG
jgi:hypothetical protein